jgi:hypothetical protein
MLTNEEVVKKFLNGEVGGAAQMFSTGEALFSHEITIAYRLQNGQRYVINVTKFKHKGLSRHQGLLRKGLNTTKAERAHQKKPPLVIDTFEKSESEPVAQGKQ